MAPPRPGVAALAALLVLSARRKTQRARQATPSGFLGDDAGFTEGARGVVAGLLLTGSDFGFVTLLGIISLSGIVINNAIVLIDRIRIEIDDNGPAPREAVLAAARARLRPILLTTATTIGGLMPMWLGGRSHVGAHGHQHRLRPRLRHGPHPGPGAGPLQPPVRGVLPGRGGGRGG